MANPATGATSTQQQDYGGNAITLPTSVTQTPSVINQTSPTADTSGTTGGDQSWLSSFGGTLGNILKNPIVSAGIPIGLSLYQNRRTQNQNQALTGAISQTTQPANQLGTAVTNQMLGGAPAGGPAGQTVGGVNAVNQQLLGTAGQYASGNLTPAQQMQVDQYTKGQKATLASQLGGNINSSAGLVGQQQIDNNAIMMTQNLVQGNVNLAQGALQAVGQAFSNLITQGLNASGLGFKGTATAVQEQIAANQQTQGLLQQIFSGIASQFTTAAGGKVSQQGGNQPTTPGGQLGAAAGQLLQKYFGGNQTGQTPALESTSNVNIADPTAGIPANSGAGFSWGNFGGDTGGATDMTQQYSMSAPGGTLDTSGFTPVANAGGIDWLGGMTGSSTDYISADPGLSALVPTQG